ncbi:MAG: hypothetical protein JXD23_00075 [Spirochaetales bacterium]|nr:hypothetical protein [Spirochaetales bacterium]
MESFIDHEDAQKHIPPAVREHLLGLIDRGRLPPTDDILHRLIEAWLLKKAAFQKAAEHGGFQSSDLLRRDDRSACLVLTLSGSLVSIGPLQNGRRRISYTSIGLRTDVPETLEIDDGALAEDVATGRPMKFAGGKLKQTSTVTDLAAARPEAGEAEQAAGLRKAGDKLKTEFVRFNRETLEKTDDADVLRRRDDLFQKWIILQWFLLGGLERHVFTARAKILWLELFTGIYDALRAKVSDPPLRDMRFLEFTNHLFAKFCDDYKWYESEHKNFDIGLMKALEEIPEYPAYVGFVEDYRRKL